MLYQALRETVKSKGTMIPYSEDISKHIKANKDYYVSLYQYTDEHKKLFDERGSVSGIRDTTTDRLYFDFDSKNDLEAARKDAVNMAAHLIENQNIPEEAIQAYYTGRKGFALEIKLNDRITPDQLRSVIVSLSDKFPTLDTQVVDPNRIIRVPNTPHPDSKLYKIPLELWELDELAMANILQLAENPRNISKRVVSINLPKSFIPVSKPVTTRISNITVSSDLDYSRKPKFLTNCRWALQNGHFSEGSRSTAFLCLAATYKNLGFDLEHVYRMLKGVAELQSKKNDSDRFPDEEIYNNVILQVFSDSWSGGQYSCRQEGNWLKSYCDGLGDHSCSATKTLLEEPHTLIEISSGFKDYVKNIDKNTIHTGIPTLDKNIFISTGANVGIIGAPGAGKSALALNILNNTSKAGVKSVFASLDMHRNRMFEKVMYKISGHKREDLYKIFQEDKEGLLLEKLKEEFGNVFFFNKSSPSVADIRDYVLECQEKSGEKIKFVMLDYFERVSSDFSDDTQASKRVAGELQDLVNDLDIALITLVQPNKNALTGGADSPIYDYTKIKGSSFVYQAFRIILSLWRPFYNPKDFSNDKFMQMAVLKNDLGELSEFAFNWHGKTGTIAEMDDYQYDELERMLRDKEAEKNEETEGW